MRTFAACSMRTMISTSSWTRDRNMDTYSDQDCVFFLADDGISSEAIAFDHVTTTSRLYNVFMYICRLIRLGNIIYTCSSCFGMCNWLNCPLVIFSANESARVQVAARSWIKVSGFKWIFMLYSLLAYCVCATRNSMPKQWGGLQYVTNLIECVYSSRILLVFKPIHFLALDRRLHETESESKDLYDPSI